MDRAPPRPEGAPVSGLPHAAGKSFVTLDDYLAYLRELGGFDIPYYEEVEPGIYQVMAGQGGLQPQRYTREQLERRFGFRTD